MQARWITPLELWNDLSDETVALIGADTADVEAHLNGSISQETFAARWWKGGIEGEARFKIHRLGPCTNSDRKAYYVAM